jgi:cytochrome c oxidase cbb3-type subunit 2
MTPKQLLIGLAVTFGLPWLALVILPYGSLAGLKPVPYGEDEEMKGFFPPALASSEARGQAAYISEGCIQCHTQVIRPQYVSGDGDEFKKGWGADQKSAAPVRTRYTTPYDYLGETFAVIGTRRHGPDLANAGYRFASRKEVLEHFFNPRAGKKWSTCPSYGHLFDERPVLGKISENSVKISKDREAVAGDKALALADYILALKRDHPLPLVLGGKPATAAAPAPSATPAAPPAAGATPAPTTPTTPATPATPATAPPPAPAGAVPPPGTAAPAPAGTTPAPPAAPPVQPPPATPK